MKKSILYTALAVMIPYSASADINIDFETEEGYTAIGVYDCWEQSPFRTNVLTGNAAIVSNPDQSVDEALGEPINPSEKVLGAQRSRFGSNLFGVRVDLAEKFNLSTDWQYVHVMVNRPVSGRVALVGLGKRTDREDQTGEEEQFWYLSNTEVTANKWCDAVFGIKGSSDVEIYSFVVVPECESPHNSTEDFLFYIDDITVNDEIQPRKSTEFYQINFNKATESLSRSDRYLNSISLNSPSYGTQTASIPQQSTKMLYYYEPDIYFHAKAGETVTPSVSWSGDWMHSYVYLDRANDGQFEAAVADNGYTPADGTDLMSFSAIYVNGTYYNSVGSTNTGNNRTLPSFTIPADLPAGVYRMRYKMDWSDIDPGGNTASGNVITDNGGAIADIIIVICNDDPITVRANQLNGDVLTAEDEKLENHTATINQPFTVKMSPAPGFEYSGMRVRHGYGNLEGDSLYHDNPQYRDEIIDFLQFDENDCYTIPAEIMDGNVLIEGYFVTEGSLPQRITLTYNLMYNDEVVSSQDVTATIGEEYPSVTWSCEASTDYYSISGMPEGVVKEGETEIQLELTHSLPFQVSKDFNNAYWYNLALTSDKCYLTHVSSYSYINLGSGTTTQPQSSDYASQWCFVGDVFNGFKIYNRGAGESMLLSSSESITSSNDGTTYPIMRTEPVSTGYNSKWIPTKSTYLTSDGGFYLHQLGYVSNRMNSRNNRLAYWVGGADAGSTFTVLYADSTSGIEDITGDQNNAPIEYFNLQGIKVSSDNLTPGIYIRRQGNNVTKILMN